MLKHIGGKLKLSFKAFSFLAHEPDLRFIGAVERIGNNAACQERPEIRYGSLGAGFFACGIERYAPFAAELNNFHKTYPLLYKLTGIAV